MRTKRRKKLPVILEPKEIESLMRIPNKRYLSGKRNLAVLSLMLNMGLRVSEVSKLKSGNINLTENKLRVVGGKGGVDRDLIIPFYTSELLKEWKKVKPKSEWFFTTIKDVKDRGRFNTKKGSQFKITNIQAMVKKYSKRAGINNKQVSPHVLRHTFATNFIKQGGNVMHLKEILGHASVSTSQIYITLALKDVKEAMLKFKEFKI
ncbi:Tyrosine recombinase XerC [subsurface metagenome]